MKVDQSLVVEPALAESEISSAIESLFARMNGIDAQCGDAFPLYSPAFENRWVTSGGGSWIGGFWAGCWWLRAHLTNSKSDRNKATQISQRLASKISTESINRSMIFWYGAALGEIWVKDENAGLLTEEARTQLALSYDPELGCIPLGTQLGGGDEGDRHIAIDALAPVIQLLNYGRDRKYEDLSRKHVDTVIAACLTEIGACHVEASYQSGKFHPIGRAGVWSRGQAWAMLGLSEAAIRWGDPYIEHAQSACVYWQQSRIYAIPPNRFDQPSGLSDPSASLIAALAMLNLSFCAKDKERWEAYAHRHIATLVRSQYFKQVAGETAVSRYGHAVSEKIFWGCSYQIKPGVTKLVESAWGTFLLLQMLCILGRKLNVLDSRFDGAD